MDVERNEQASETTKITSAPRPTSGNASDAPPSYDSLYGQLKSVRNEASGPGDYVSKSCGILCASVIGTILLAPVLAIPIAMIVVGSIHLNDCPVERYIPIYLIVGGCFGALQTILTFSLRLKNHREDKNEGRGRQQQNEDGSGNTDSNARPNPGSGIISCFLLAWFIAGSVWVYRIYTTVDTSDVSSSHYCHGSVYWFAFVLITVGYVCMALSCCCAALCGILGVIFTKN